jgi:hypothetical protein
MEGEPAGNGFHGEHGKANMKLGLRIILLSLVSMITVFAIAAYMMVSAFRHNAAAITVLNDRRHAEVERINALPELRCVIVSSGLVLAPLTREDAAACMLVQGRRLQLSRAPGYRGTSSSGPKYRYDDDVVVLAGTDMMVSIDGVPFPFTLDSIILSRPVAAKEGALQGNGRTGRRFESNTWKNWLYPGSKEDERQVSRLRGRSGLLDAYIRKEGRVGDPEVILHEVLFALGDTLSFRGCIKDGRLIALY